jgi:hypothetical protein
MLVIHPAFYLSFYVLPWDTQERLRSNRLLNRTVSCKLVGDFISSYPSMSRGSTYSHYVLSYPRISRDPIYSHFVAGRYIMQRPLPLCANREVVWTAWRALRAALISDWLIYCMKKSPSSVVHRSQGILFCLWDLKYIPLVHKCQLTPSRNRPIDFTRAILFLENHFNHLTPNGHFSGRTSPLTYRCFIF